MRIKQKPNHTTVSLFIVLPAMFFMAYIVWRHWTDEWGPFALYWQLIPAVIGFFGLQLLKKEPIFPKTYGQLDDQTMIHFSVALVGIFVAQIIAGYMISITDWEYAFYVAFAAPLEEMFWRAFLITVFLTLLGRSVVSKVIAVIASSVLFMLAHQSYWGNLMAMIQVLLSGIALGTTFAIWEDLTGNILAHFIWNFVLALRLFNDLTMWLVLIGVFATIFILAFVLSPKKKKLPSKYRARPRMKAKYR